MAKVKGGRRYDSSLRKAQAGQTRMRILDAAEKLLSERGFAATTMESIAAAAGVATDTVYASFGNKAGVLHRLLDVRVGGDELPISLLDREGPKAVRSLPTQKAQVAAFAADIATILERARPVDDIMRGAAAVDPEIAALRERMQAFRYSNLMQFVSWLRAKGPLRGGMTAEEAAAIVWTLASPEVNGLLRRDRRWSKERYVAWLADTLARTLL
ncbi:MAG TPA: helix-turn-helix domain-containing protein [Candidatus Dormibacteraeota bacterium]